MTSITVVIPIKFCSISDGD